jgi:hypothetical protein
MGIGGFLYMVTNDKVRIQLSASENFAEEPYHSNDKALQHSSHWRSIELINQGKRMLWDLLWLQDFRGRLP